MGDGLQGNANITKIEIFEILQRLFLKYYKDWNIEILLEILQRLFWKDELKSINFLYFSYLSVLNNEVRFSWKLMTLIFILRKIFLSYLMNSNSFFLNMKDVYIYYHAVVIEKACVCV